MTAAIAPPWAIPAPPTRRLWKVWAGKGNAEARTLLGAMYWSGEGVPRDHKEAARLYLLAANQGYARAQNDIRFMLGFGEGIPPRDDVEAYKWLALAMKGYTARNQERLDQAKKDWEKGPGHPRFPFIPGDDREFIPLPENTHPPGTVL